MKKIIIIIMMVLGFFGKSFAYDYRNFYTINNWSIQDVILESTLGVLFIIDYCYSLDIYYSSYKERNPVITSVFQTEHPKRWQFITIGVIVWSIHACITNIIPSGKFRTLWQSTSIAIETSNILYLEKIGVQFHCPI
jgi:hypothetical protein